MFLDKKDKIAVTEAQSVATTEMSNITNYYPLAEGIGNFLKVPKVIKSDSNERTEIVEKGVREFLRLYKDTAPFRSSSRARSMRKLCNSTVMTVPLICIYQK